MDQQIYGVMYHSDDSESEHEHDHELYLINWDGMPVHVHPFSGVTSFDDGHRHGYAGMTEPAPNGVPHTHAYSTTTSFNDRHSHAISGRTGPAIPLQGGGHLHIFQGVTTVNGATPHRHSYSGRTGNEQK